MTDQQIIIEVLKKKGLNEVDIRPRLGECTKVMSDSFSQAFSSEEITILDGVPELLEKLTRQGFLMGLVTGNLESIARGKLKKAGIEGFFKVGGFGSDHIDRAELVRIAIREAEENFNFQPDNNVFLFGDAPQDMKAAKEGGAKAIGVTTGIYTREQLEEAGANIVLANLKDKNKILEVLEMFGPGQKRKI
jgi:phosphoglycolate phosphatase-like HAD superfamily hydrolase